MEEYLTEAAYKRWYRQYQVSLGHYLEVLDGLRLRLDTLPYDRSIEECENLIDEIDENLDMAIPRNFNGGGEPLAGFEKFSENSKVLINLILKFLKKPGKFKGIYKEEKDRVQLVHQKYKFKDQLKKLSEMVTVQEALIRPEMQEEKQAIGAE